MATAAGRRLIIDPPPTEEDGIVHITLTIEGQEPEELSFSANGLYWDAFTCAVVGMQRLGMLSEDIYSSSKYLEFQNVWGEDAE